MDDFEIVTPDPSVWPLLHALSDPKLPPKWRERLVADFRLTKPCEACEHPGYAHDNADRQYATGHYGVPEFEAGDIGCEAERDVGGYVSGCDCEWYEGDNWRKKHVPAR